MNRSEAVAEISKTTRPERLTSMNAYNSSCHYQYLHFPDWQPIRLGDCIPQTWRLHPASEPLLTYPLCCGRYSHCAFHVHRNATYALDHRMVKRILLHLLLHNLCKEYGVARRMLLQALPSFFRESFWNEEHEYTRHPSSSSETIPFVAKANNVRPCVPSHCRRMGRRGDNSTTI